MGGSPGYDYGSHKPQVCFRAQSKWQVEPVAPVGRKLPRWSDQRDRPMLG